jgi:hypothetical protein
MGVEELNELSKLVYSAWSREINSKGLTKLDKGFYERVSALLSRVEEEMRNAEDLEVQINYLRIISKIKHSLRTIARRRFQKLAELAASSQDGEDPRIRQELELILPEERRFYESLVQTFLKFSTLVTKGPGKRASRPRKGIALLITRDVGSFVMREGREVTLRKGDIVLIDAEVAKLLLDRGVARKIRLSPRS